MMTSSNSWNNSIIPSRIISKDQFSSRFFCTRTQHYKKGKNEEKGKKNEKQCELSFLITNKWNNIQLFWNDWIFSLIILRIHRISQFPLSFHNYLNSFCSFNDFYWLNEFVSVILFPFHWFLSFLSSVNNQISFSPFLLFSMNRRLVTPIFSFEMTSTRYSVLILMFF